MDQDTQILSMLDKQARDKANFEIDDWHIDKFEVGKHKFSPGSSLHAFDDLVIEMRAQFLLELSVAF